ncbi:hypothetical protein HETIRDRAFT_435767 [Heterobasidion irregulare TC 32-1]|uniref:NADP-dependent oxidoreductase domain-containing protein n=1 Tax=Heterobasidion irregulare (strain TC 32-1) TaxID=747525 RepID=W4JVY7_HETIT|nr:uncharacterized protein HETIRDRAFT_435767 [Heterobasidion irregulare TC 32-1]ETW77723.1 hypothetical protein HETIRDRAFT_435767 [Heterobasidion irregulare TC 32-1]
MASQTHFKLNTGASMPAIAFGTWAGLTKEERLAAKLWIISALQAGYRHLDTAWFYGTEVSVGAAIRESGIPREDIFVTTKLPWHHCGKVAESINQSLTNLGLDYVDLYLIHWPQAMKFYSDDNSMPRTASGDLEVVEFPTFVETWAAMEQVLASGKAKAIGVSNFSIKHLERLLQTAKVVPAVNQVELNPLLTQNDLVAYSESKGIRVAAYTPSGYAAVREHPTILELATKYHSTANQITLGWHLARGVAVVTASKNTERQQENLKPATLEWADIENITALNRNLRQPLPTNENGKVMGWTLEQLGW